MNLVEFLKKSMNNTMTYRIVRAAALTATAIYLAISLYEAVAVKLTHVVVK